MLLGRNVCHKVKEKEVCSVNREIPRSSRKLSTAETGKLDLAEKGKSH